MDEFGIQIDDDSEFIITDSDNIKENSDRIELYQWQRDAITFFFEHNNKALYEIATGGGKTVMAIEIIKQIIKKEPETRVLIVVPKNVILETGWYKELYNNGISLNQIGVYYGSIKELAKITITNMQNLKNIPMELFQGVVFDECFSGDTNVLILVNDKIVEIPIKKLVEEKLNNYVLSYNIEKKCVEPQKIIKHHTINEKRTVLDIELDDGTILTVTPEQLIYNGKKYVVAENLKPGETILQW